MATANEKQMAFEEYIKKKYSSETAKQYVNIFHNILNMEFGPSLLKISSLTKLKKIEKEISEHGQYSKLMPAYGQPTRGRNVFREFVEFSESLSNSNPVQSSDVGYQAEVFKIAVTKGIANFREAAGPGKVPEKIVIGSRSRYQRNCDIAASALKTASFLCEKDATHKTFVSRASGKQYVEAHHLVPFSNQGSFQVSLDVTANVVSLCPMCHSFLHHGRPTEISKFLSILLKNRKKRLDEKKIEVSREDLLGYYNHLQDEDV